jgi:4-aminobutyrate aminotransferase/(S)-3-amino-2-methylpropionate transaminase
VGKTSTTEVTPGTRILSRIRNGDAPHITLEGGLGDAYAGNPISCAAALAVLEIIKEENLLEKAVQLGELLRRHLLQLQQRYPKIGDVRGLGPMMAAELVEDPATREPDSKSTRALLDAACRRGLILPKSGTYNNVVRFLIPLNIRQDHLKRGLDILAKAFAEIYSP